MANPRLCPACHGIFMTAVTRRDTQFHCPVCARIVKLRDCHQVSVPDLSEQEYLPVTREEDCVRALDELGQRQQRWMLTAAAMTAIVFVAALTAAQFRKSPPAPVRSVAIPPVPDGEMEAAMAVARRVIGAADWRAALPDISDSARVQPVMEWYYDRFPETAAPAHVTGCLSSKLREIAGRSLLLLRLDLAAQLSRFVWMEKRDGVWKLDWESYAMPSVAQWAHFIRQPAGTVIEVRMLAGRYHAADSSFQTAGLIPGEADAISLRADPDPEAPVGVAILHKADPLWKELAELRWDQSLQCIVRATMVEPAADPPLVKLDRVVQHGWLRGADLRHFKDASLVLPLEKRPGV